MMTPTSPTTNNSHDGEHGFESDVDPETLEELFSLDESMKNIKRASVY